MKIAIIGAGIGGLTAANALQKFGFDFKVYERSSELGEVGAGLQIGPSAVKVMRGLGLESKLLQRASRPQRMITLNWDEGSVRYQEPFQQSFQAFGAPYLTAHRADLHGILRDNLPRERIELDKTLTGIQRTGDVVKISFADGTSELADLVIGADGIHSAVRKCFWGETPARFTNSVCWRATVPIDRVPAAVGPNGSVALNRDDIVMWLGPTGGLLWYPVRSGELLNIFAGKFSDAWVAESWSHPSSREELLDAYSGWNKALLEVLSHVDEPFKWGIFDRDPMASWTNGRTTLLGDAAHPMMPTLAQGAAIAMEDGYALARNLASTGNDPEQALQRYEAERVPRTSRVQLQARQQSENNRKIPPPKQLDRNWIFEHDVTA